MVDQTSSQSDNVGFDSGSSGRVTELLSSESSRPRRSHGSWIQVHLAPPKMRNTKNGTRKEKRGHIFMKIFFMMI